MEIWTDSLTGKVGARDDKKSYLRPGCIPELPSVSRPDQAAGRIAESAYREPGPGPRKASILRVLMAARVREGIRLS